MGLAYEIVINSSPCISYLMEENTATMQTLVIAHAAFGHNHFFKNNYLFKQWTDADGILDYLEFAKGYIAACEDRHGRETVERTLDAAHALMSHGVDRYPGKKTLDLRAEREARRRAPPARARPCSTISGGRCRTPRPRPEGRAHGAGAAPCAARPAAGEHPLLPREDRPAPCGHGSARSFASCVTSRSISIRKRQTKVMNEGCGDLRALPHHEPAAQQGRITDGNFLEFLQSHTNVVFQPSSTTAAIRGFTSLCARLRDDAGHRAAS
jgi:stage V sporulation protein R